MLGILSKVNACSGVGNTRSILLSKRSLKFFLEEKIATDSNSALMA